MIEQPDFRNTMTELAMAIDSKAAYGSALAVERTHLTLKLDSKTYSIDEKTSGTGAVFRAFDGDMVEELSVNSMDSKVLKKEVRRFAGTVGKGGKKFSTSMPPAGASDFITPVLIDPQGIALDEKIEACTELKHLLLNLDSHVKDIQIVYNETRERSVFADRSRNVFQEIIRTGLHFIVFGQFDGMTIYETYSHGGTIGFEAVTFTADELARVKDNLLALSRATFIAPGTYNAVTSPATTGIIAHESFGHGVEMDVFLKRNARARLYMGKEIASPLVVMRDDPSLPGGYGTYFFDDEGMPARPVTIIDQGVLVSGLSDMLSALRLDSTHTSNGRRESYSRKAYARMSNTFIEPQRATLDELLDMAGDGVYLESPSGGIEDPQGWGIQITAKLGREFRKGKFTGRTYSPVGITGYVPELLGSIRAIGSDFRMFPGLCGKGYKEMIPVGIGGPHILVKCRLG